MSRIAIIGLSSLEAMGIKGLIANIPVTDMTPVEICVYNRFEELVCDADKTDLFTVGVSIFAQHIEFFMPRRGRIILVNPDEKPQSHDTGEEEGTGSSLRQIFRNTTEDDLSLMLRTVLEEPTGKGEMSGELSVREKEVLKEVASGNTNKEIADRLSISVNTVITHRKNISAKLGIKSVSGLSLYALMNGII